MFLSKINDSIALKTVAIMSSIWCVYAFLVWSLVPTLIPALQDFVFYVSGGIIQLVALPLIMVGQNLMGAAAEQRAQEDHEHLLEILKDIQEDHENLKIILASLQNK
jgi:uncharacterized membrane protein